MFEKEYLPYCLLIGISYDQFWKINPRIVKVYQEAYRLREKKIDEEAWMLGAYINNAVTVSIDHCLNGKKATSKYYEKPFLQMTTANVAPTNEIEKNERIEHLFNGLKMLQTNFEIAKKGDMSN